MRYHVGVWYPQYFLNDLSQSMLLHVLTCYLKVLLIFAIPLHVLAARRGHCLFSHGGMTSWRALHAKNMDLGEKASSGLVVQGRPCAFGHLCGSAMWQCYTYATESVYAMKQLYNIDRLCSIMWHDIENVWNRIIVYCFGGLCCWAGQVCKSSSNESEMHLTCVFATLRKPVQLCLGGRCFSPHRWATLKATELKHSGLALLFVDWGMHANGYELIIFTAATQEHRSWHVMLAVTFCSGCYCIIANH